MDGSIQPAAEAADEQSGRRTCILVLGMHRSGTSALTRLLNLTGAALPKHIMGADRGNSTGHWEPKLVQELNDELLREVGSSWDDWRGGNFSSLPAHRRFYYKAAISELLMTEYGDAALFVLKEPRICRLAPVYLDVLRELEVDVRVVIPFRNPLDVSASLETRDGLHPQISELFWIRHVLDAERDTRGLKRSFVDYDTLILDWSAQVAKLSAELSLPFSDSRPDAKSSVEEFLRPELRHHRSGHRALERSQIVSGWSRAVFGSLLELQLDPACAHAQAQLDDVRDHFDQSVNLFGAHFAKLKLERDDTAKARDLLEQQLAEMQTRMLDERQSAEQQIAAIAANRDHDAAELASVSALLEAARASLATSESDYAEAGAGLLATQAELADLRVKYMHVDETAASLAAVRDALEEQLEAAMSMLNEKANALDMSVASLEAATEDAVRIKEEHTQILETLEAEKNLSAAKLLEERNFALADEQRKWGQVIASMQSEIDGKFARLIEDSSLAIASLKADQDRAIASLQDDRDRVVESLESQLIENQTVVDAFRKSTSWKVTRPLRAVKKIRVRMSEGRDAALVDRSDLFDREWYLGAYADVRAADMDPLVHFVRYGGQEGRSPSPLFDSRHYLQTNQDVAKRNLNPLVHYLRFGRNELRPPLPKLPVRNVSAPAIGVVLEQDPKPAGELRPQLQRDAAFEALSADVPSVFGEPEHPAHQDQCKLVAFYLPQFHRVRENSEWWSPGFTEWTNVARGRPNFEGHYQPHIPRELGYYDLSNVSVLQEQARMARLYGISGFCFYHYWFSGRRILERPVEQFLQSDIDLEFCLCWANENWTRTWDGDTKSVLLAQEYRDEDALEFITSILPALKDPRYIQVDEMPLLVVYRAKDIPAPQEWFDLWRSVAKENGLKGLHISVVDFYDIAAPDEVGADSLVEFPPHKFNGSQNQPDHFPELTNPEFAGGIVDYCRMIIQSAKRATPPFQLFRGIIPSWDNTARRQSTPTIILNSSPDLFGAWLSFLRRYTRITNANPDRRLVFINAWNEWGEGCHLEPDMKWGLAHLEEVLASSYATSTDSAFSLDEAVTALKVDLATCTSLSPAPDAADVPSLDLRLQRVSRLFADHEIPSQFVLRLSSALRRWPAVHASVRQSYRRMRQMGR